MNQTFSNCIREARYNKGYSQRDLAALVKVDYTYLSKLENDRTEYAPSEEIIKLLAHHLELDSQELIYQAGRITAEDAKVVGELAKTHQKQLPMLLRLIRDNPELTRKFFGKQ
jgi:HTH-type transcriptional regulator, competence development regulator